jgi:hypothetical protein
LEKLKMKIKFERTKEQLELVKAMASANRQEAYEAQQALAAFVGPVLSEVINTAPTLSNVFTQFTFNFDDNPSLPIDLFYDITDEDYIKVYSQSMPGGLPSNTVVPTASEMKVATYTLDSAYNFDRRYAAKSRLDVVAKVFARMGQEVLLKQERTSANVILGTLADNASEQLINSVTTTNSVLLPADFNNLIVKAKRVNTSWTKGTPANRVGGVTDLWMSPERMADLRAMAYNPINNVSNDQQPAAGEDSGLAAPDSIRAQLFNGAGIPTFYGFTLHEINELGVGQRYTKVFDSLYGGTFTSTDDLILGIDMSSEGLIRAVAADPESNTQIQLEVDDQFVSRQRKIGYYMSLEEGRMVLDRRTIFGIRLVNASR